MERSKIFFLSLFVAAFVAAVVYQLVRNPTGGSISRQGLKDVEHQLLDRIDYLNKNALFGKECSLDETAENLMDFEAAGSPKLMKLADSLLVACQSTQDYATVDSRVHAENFVVELTCEFPQAIVRRAMYAHLDRPLTDSFCKVGVFFKSD